MEYAYAQEITSELNVDTGNLIADVTIVLLIVAVIGFIKRLFK